MTSGSFQTQPQDLYVDLYLKVGQIISMKWKWFLYSFSSRLNAKCVFPTPVGAMNNPVCSSFINIFILIYSRNVCAMGYGYKASKTSNLLRFSHFSE